MAVPTSKSLQSAIRSRRHSIILYAFDLLHLDGIDPGNKLSLSAEAS